MPSTISLLRNLAKARVRWRPPRPLRSRQEARMIRRFTFQWFTCRGRKPSGRAWARALGVSHTWIQKLVKEFAANSSEMQKLQASEGDPKYPEFIRAQARSQQMRARGELRLSRRARMAKVFERY